MLVPMPTFTCGHNRLHFYGYGEFCQCGQVPKRFLTPPLCDCGGARLKPPLHEPECRAVKWVDERAAWVTAHPDTYPALPEVNERRVRQAQLPESS